MILILMVEGARAVISFCIRSAIPGYMVVPPYAEGDHRPCSLHHQDQDHRSPRERGKADKGMVEVSKVVVFCLDWSASMMSQDTGTKFTRFGICVDRVQKILREQVRDQDLVGVVGFGANFQTVIPPTQKGQQ